MFMRRDERTVDRALSRHGHLSTTGVVDVGKSRFARLPLDLLSLLVSVRASPSAASTTTRRKPTRIKPERSTVRSMAYVLWSCFDDWHGALRIGSVEHSRKGLCTYAAKHGFLTLLCWSRTFCPWSRRTTAAAARSGHLEVLRWLLTSSPSCPFGKTTWTEAAKHDRVGVIEWLCAQPRFLVARRSLTTLSIGPCDNSYNSNRSSSVLYTMLRSNRPIIYCTTDAVSKGAIRVLDSISLETFPNWDIFRISDATGCSLAWRCRVDASKASSGCAPTGLSLRRAHCTIMQPYSTAGQPCDGSMPMR